MFDRKAYIEDIHWNRSTRLEANFTNQAENTVFCFTNICAKTNYLRLQLFHQVTKFGVILQNAVEIKSVIN